jgi:hypothetical protein
MSIRPFRAAILLFTILIGVPAFAQSYTWQHFAGDPGGGGSIDGNGTNARLHSGGLTRDRAGNLYFADTTANVIRRVTPGGEVTTVAGLAGVTGFVNGTDSTARFNRPVGLAVDANDNILVADTWNHVIRKITPAGVVTTFAGNTSFNPFYFPEGVAVDRSNGTVYVADTLNHVVRKIVNGTVSVLAGTSGSSGNVNGTGSAARFNEPRGISVDTNGDIYVGDSGNSTIRKITPAGVVTTVSSPFGNNFADGFFGNARFNKATQLSFAANRDLFISDQDNGRIRKASGGIVSTAALLEYPTGVTADEAGGAFAVSRFGIRQVTGGSANPFVGLGSLGGYADGNGADARFKGPYDADTDSLGNVYIADANNCSIRKITPAGVVTTLAGVPGQCGSTDGNLSTARFYGSLYGIDVDDNGNIYIAEGWSHVIRKIAADGTVTTIAGTATLSGHVNAAGSAARFNVPYDVAVAPTGDLYVADTYNHVIRKIAPDGTVTTLAGSPGVSGTVNGSGSAARFYYPQSITYAGGELFVTQPTSGGIRRVTLSGDVVAISDVCGGGAWSTPWGITSDAAGALYISDYGNAAVRKMVRSGLNFCITNIGGSAGQRGSEDGTGGFARLGAPVGTAVAPDGTLYVVEQAWLGVRRGTPATIADAPTVPASSGPAGTPVTLGVSGTGSDSWQWQIVRRPGASSGTLLSSATVRTPVFTPDVAGLYTFLLTATGPAGISMRRIDFTATCVAPPAPAITVTAGSNPSCAGQSVTLEAAAGYTSYLWSNGATTRAITVSPSVQTTYSVTGYNGTCASPSSSHVQAMTTATNTIAVSGSATMCAGGSGGTATATDTGTPASRQWGWRATTGGAITSIAGQTGVSYALLASDFPGAGTYFLVSRVTSSCGTTTVSNEVAVTINSAPAATITPSGPTTFCEGGSVTLQAAAGNTYLWSTGATTQSIAATASGSYSVTVTSAAGCSATSAPVSVTVNPLPPVPVITASGPTSFCEGGSVTLTAPDGYSYLWSNGATTRAITVGTAGDYSVTVTSNGCSAASAPTSVTVLANPAAPEIAAGGPTTFCQGGSVTLTAPAGFNYQWSTGATSQSIQVSTAGNYSVTVTNANGCSATSAATAVTVNSLPAATISASGPTTFCDGGSVTLTANAASSYLWSNGATTQSIIVTAGGSYSVTTTNAAGCSNASAATSVTVQPLPDAEISASTTTLCQFGGAVLTAPLASSYLWSSGQTTRDIVVFQPGTWSVTVTGANGCSATSAPVTVTADPTTVTIVADDTTVCPGQTIHLTSSVANGPALSYQWFGFAGHPIEGETGPELTTVADQSYYFVRITTPAGCTARSNTVVISRQTPDATVTTSGPTTFCEGGSVDLFAPDGAYTYLWSNGATSSWITVTEPGSYTVTITSTYGCTATSEPVVVDVTPLPDATITADGPTTFCEGGSVTLSAPAGSTYAWSTGATTQSIVVTESGSYSVTVTNAEGCSSDSAATTVTVNALPAPTIGASGPTTFCEGGSVTLTASAGSSYLWSTGATTSSIVATQSGSYSVTVTNANGCSATSAGSTVTVNANPEASINASGATTFCEGGSVTLTASAGSSYLWSNGATIASIVATQSGSYTVTVTNANGCSTTSAATSVTVNANPVATISASGPTTFCTGGSVTLTASAGSSYLWSTGATTSSIVATQSGSYTVTVTNANGCSTTSAATSVTVNANPAATISASGPTTFCTGGSVTLTGSAGSSYLWSTGATTASIDVTQSGSYTVTVTNANGCSTTSAATSVTVNANPAATISASGPTTFCTGGSVTLTASAGSSYLWSNGATTSSINVTQSGSYTVTVTNANGCSTTSAATPVTVNANPAATISASGPTTFCTGGSVTLTASAGSSYLWSNGATTSSINVTQSGSYTVTVTNASGCSTTSAATSVTVNANPAATISASGPTTFCTGGSVTLTASAGSSYLWSNGATTSSINVTQSGSYTVTVTNANGCSTTSAATSVTVNAKPAATISASGPTTFCTGGSVTLTASAGSSYLWSNGATTPSINVTQSGSYTVTVTNANGCSTTSAATSVTVNANPAATISASGPTTFCQGGAVTLTASAGSSYLWSTGATTSSIVATQSGSYTVTVTNASGCSTTSAATSVTVNANPAATISASGPTTFCQGGAVTLTASAGSSYLWSNGATTSSIVATQSGSYTVTVTNANGCSTTSAATSVTVNANPAATISASGPTTFCTGGSVTLTASAGSSYLWSNGATTPSINVTQSGSHTVTVTNASGCSTTSAATSVTVNANPAATISASGPTTFCTGGSVTLTASPGSSYLWSNGATTSSINVAQSGSYTVTVTNANGCSTTSAATSVTVNAKPAATISASGPTTFCTGGSVTLTASVGSSYLWSTGATTSSIVATQSGSYTVTVTNASGCSTTSAATPVTVNAKPATPTINASGPTTFCPGGSVTLTAPAGFTYLWSDGATTQSIVVTTAGSRSVTVTNASGCSATSAATTVTVNAATSISVQPQTKTIPKNTSTQLSVTASGTGTLAYQWYRGTSGNTAQPIAGATNSTYNTPVLSKGTYTYWVRVTGTCGFVNSNTATVTAN